MENDKWKARFNEFLVTCQDELKKTTQIGRKMLSASKTNTELHNCYEELGKYLCEQIRLKKHEWNDDEVTRLIGEIEKCENDLEVLEKDVSSIKKAHAFEEDN